MSDDAGLACHREQFSLERLSVSPTHSCAGKDSLQAVLVRLPLAQCWKLLPGLWATSAASELSRADLHRSHNLMKQHDAWVMHGSGRLQATRASLTLNPGSP